MKPTMDAARRKRAIAASLLWLGLSSVLWLWPLLYFLNQGQGCGADLGLGMFGFPAAAVGTVGAGVMAIRHRHDPAVVAVALSATILGASSLVGAVWALGPWASWMSWAVDHWYGSC